MGSGREIKLEVPPKRSDNHCMVNEIKEEMAMELYGRSLKLSQAGKQCVKCGEFNLEFRDDRSFDEYFISGWCQSCQDDFFGA